MNLKVNTQNEAKQALKCVSEAQAYVKKGDDFRSYVAYENYNFTNFY